MSGREKPLILQNGMPIPQEYDKDLGDWTEYSNEHIKAIKAELALVKAELQAIKANQLSGDQKVQLSGTIVELATGWNISVTAGSTVTLYEYTTKQYPARSIRAGVSGYSDFNKAQLAIRFWGRTDHVSTIHYAVSSEVVEVDAPYLRASAEADVYGGVCRVTLTNLMTTDGILASFVVLGVI